MDPKFFLRTGKSSSIARYQRDIVVIYNQMQVLGFKSTGRVDRHRHRNIFAGTCLSET